MIKCKYVFGNEHKEWIPIIYYCEHCTDWKSDDLVYIKTANFGYGCSDDIKTSELFGHDYYIPEGRKAGRQISMAQFYSPKTDLVIHIPSTYIRPDFPRNTGNTCIWRSVYREYVHYPFYPIFVRKDTNNKVKAVYAELERKFRENSILYFADKLNEEDARREEELLVDRFTSEFRRTVEGPLKKDLKALFDRYHITFTSVFDSDYWHDVTYLTYKGKALFEASDLFEDEEVIGKVERNNFDEDDEEWDDGYNDGDEI